MRVGQIVWVWTVSLPVTILNSPAVSDLSSGGSNPAFGTARDIAGVIVWGVGFIIESVADAEKVGQSGRTVLRWALLTQGSLCSSTRSPPDLFPRDTL